MCAFAHRPDTIFAWCVVTVANGLCLVFSCLLFCFKCLENSGLFIAPSVISLIGDKKVFLIPDCLLCILLHQV